LAIDAVGNVWTVRPGFGITVIPPTGSAIHYTEGTGTLTDNDTVWSIFIDSEQRKWIGFLGNGIDVFSPDNQQRNNVTYDAIAGDVVNDIVEANNGDIWLAIDPQVNMSYTVASQGVTAISSLTVTNNSPTLNGTTTTFT